MKYDWSDIKTFEEKGSRAHKSFITISERNSITLSSGFVRQAEQQILNMTHVVLGFSEANNAIIFHFINDDNSPEALKISPTPDVKKKGNSTIASKSFFSYFSIDAKKYAGKYEAFLEDVPNLGKTWVVFLKKR